MGQVFYPPYLFSRGGAAAARPSIVRAPRQITYRGHFDVEVDGAAEAVGAVAILRSDHNTHSLTAGDRYVKLAFHPKGNPSDREIRVVAPRLPAQAVPGIYMLFVLDKNGVPSMARQLRLLPETRGGAVPFR